MSPADGRIVLLRTELLSEWTSVETFAARARSLDPAGGPAPAAYVALALDHADQAWEALLVRLERGLGLPARSGPDWHRDLLAAAALPLAGLRPAVIPADAMADWVELLGFRHVLRHAYREELDPVRLAELVDRLPHAVAVTRAHVEALLAALA